MENRNYKTRDVMRKRTKIELDKQAPGAGRKGPEGAQGRNGGGYHVLANRKRTRAVEKREAIIEHS